MPEVQGSSHTSAIADRADPAVDAAAEWLYEEVFVKQVRLWGSTQS
jgi:hypothetical protein